MNVCWMLWMNTRYMWKMIYLVSLLLFFVSDYWALQWSSIFLPLCHDVWSPCDGVPVSGVDILLCWSLWSPIHSSRPRTAGCVWDTPLNDEEPQRTPCLWECHAPVTGRDKQTLMVINHKSTHHLNFTCNCTAKTYRANGSRTEEKSQYETH